MITTKEKKRITYTNSGGVKNSKETTDNEEGLGKRKTE